MSAPLTPGRERLKAAQAAHAEASARVGALRAQRQKLHDVALRIPEIEAQYKDACEQHAQAMAAWAQSGAAGEAPEAPRAIEQLERKLVAAQREANAANAAADALSPNIEVAQRTADSALAELRHRRGEVLFEIAAPLVEEFRQAAFTANSLREHLAGLGMIGRELIKENHPHISRAFTAINDAVRLHPVLEPGGAEASRHAWQKLIDELAGNAGAELEPPPASVDADARIRKPFPPEGLGGAA